MFAQWSPSAGAAPNVEAAHSCTADGFAGAAAAGAASHPVAAIDWISRCTLPAAPSAHTATVLTSLSVAASGHTRVSFLHSFLGLPVESLLQSLNWSSGITTRWNASPTGAANGALKPLEKKLQNSERLSPNWSL